MCALIIRNVNAKMKEIRSICTRSDEFTPDQYFDVIASIIQLICKTYFDIKNKLEDYDKLSNFHFLSYEVVKLSL